MTKDQVDNRAAVRKKPTQQMALYLWGLFAERISVITSCNQAEPVMGWRLFEKPLMCQCEEQVVSRVTRELESPSEAGK